MHQTLVEKAHHRFDIDGWRAIAVVSILLFHVNEAWVPGGYVGVDIFFVISGYVITANIARELRSGSFSYREFYRRRIRRIFPAMFACVALTLAVALALMLPSDVLKVGWSGLATAVSAANIYFTYSLDTSYFAADSHTVPLLHMWSLGVEEQFYLIWPALVVGLHSRRLLFPALVGLAIASLLFGQYLLWQEGTFLSADADIFAYYMLPSRLFQLSVGGVCALLPSAAVPRSDLTANLGFGIGGLLIAWSLAFLDAESPFPGFNAAPVTLGTALVIWAGQKRTLGFPILSSRPFRHAGNISYSLYLWHWPVLAFMRYFYGDLSPVQQFLSIPVMVALAEASYHLVETPFRRTNRAFGSVLGRFFAAPVFAFGLIIVGLVLTQGFGPWKWTSYPKELAATGKVRSASSSRTVCQHPILSKTWFTNDDCVSGPGKPTALLYGDSNAAHYIGFAGALSKRAGLTLRNFEHSSCPPILTDPAPYVMKNRLVRCRKSLKRVRPLLAEYDVIFLGASWPSFAHRGERNGAVFEKDVRDFVQFLTDQNIRVVLLAKVPTQPNFDPRCARKSLKAAWINCAELGRSRRHSVPFNDVLADIAAHDKLVRVIDPTDMFCDESTCRAYDGRIPLYYNTGHLNFRGSWRLGKRFVKQPEAKDILKFIGANRQS